MATVNLLDLRDEEDTKATGGRWARNPKGKAKAGGRQRRARKKDGDEGGKQSGFGRKSSNVSDMSDASSIASDTEAPKAPPPAAAEEAPPALAAEQAPTASEAAAASSSPADSRPSQQNALLARLSNAGKEGGAARAALLEDAMMDMPPPEALDIELGPRAGREGSEDAYGEARRVALQREAIKNNDHGAEGKEFKRKYWEYYMVKASWSDSLFTACNHTSMVPFCVIPCLWPYRLFQTIRRSSSGDPPLKVKCCAGCSCPAGPCICCPWVLIIFSLPIVAALTFAPDISKLMQDQFENIPVLKDVEDKKQTALILSIVLTVLFLLLMVFWWARILLGVGTKYQIKAAMDKPNSFVSQAMCCICAMNMRVGVHVDRAQGFLPPLKGDKIVVELSDQIALVNPPQQAMA